VFRFIGFMFKMALVTFILFVALIVIIASFSHKPAGGPAPVASPVAVQPPPVQPALTPNPSEMVVAPSPGAAFKPGDRVEVVTDHGMIYETAEVMRRHRSTGDFGPDYRPGKQAFGVPIGSTVLVEEVADDGLRVKVEDEHWKDRIGWIPIDGVRPVPTSEELAGDIVNGLSLGRRREIYLAIHAMLGEASDKANDRFPLDGSQELRLPERKKFYDGQVVLGRRSLIKEFKVDGKGLDGIDREGQEKKWPLK
jgi:hypothetical protein